MIFALEKQPALITRTDLSVISETVILEVAKHKSELCWNKRDLIDKKTFPQRREIPRHNIHRRPRTAAITVDLTLIL